jgi:hypothetical protein
VPEGEVVRHRVLSPEQSRRAINKPNVSNTCHGVSNTRPEVSITTPVVSNTTPGVSNTKVGVPNTAKTSWYKL